MAGSSYTKSDYTNSWINGSHFRDDKIQTLNAANKISWDGTGTGASQWAISSYFARVSYNYDSKYMLTMTCVPTVHPSCIPTIAGVFSPPSRLHGAFRRKSS